jgi:hypothetical protein
MCQVIKTFHKKKPHLKMKKVRSRLSCVQTIPKIILSNGQLKLPCHSIFSKLPPGIR